MSKTIGIDLGTTNSCVAEIGRASCRERVYVLV
jgi:molecular chaperone DnaK (HSP70)